jgi:hypothetical protein
MEYQKLLIRLQRISRLLTHRVGGKHGDEEDLQWRFLSLAGCREELLDPPDLGSTTAEDPDLLKKKSDVFQKFQDFQQHGECLFDRKILAMQTDWGGEYQKLNSFF